MTSRIKPILYLALATLIWGVSFSMIKVAVTEISPALFLTLRFTLAFAVTPLLWPGWWRGVTSSEWRGGLLIGGMLAFAFLTQTLGIAITTASNTAFLTGLFIVLAPFVAWVWDRERPSPAAAIALLPAIGGLLLLTRPDLGRLNGGDLLAIAAAFGFALKLVGIQIYSRRGRWPTLMSISFLPVIVVALGVAACGEETVFHPGSATWLYLAFAGLAATTGAFALTFRWQPSLSAARAGIIFTLEPVFAGVTAAFALGERLGATGMAGAGLVFVAMMISEFGTKKHKGHDH